MKKISDYINEFGLESFKERAYDFTKNFENSCILDSCSLHTGVNAGKYDFLAAYGAEQIVQDLDSLQQCLDSHSNWVFGTLGYELKNKFENLSSSNTALYKTQPVDFFVPEAILSIDKSGKTKLLKGKLPEEFWSCQMKTQKTSVSSVSSPVNRQIYLDKIDEIHELIRAGEVYELNYCVPFSHSYSSFNPSDFQKELIKKSPVPMASFYKNGPTSLCGASMERFLAKTGDTLTSQPIKGTIRKGSDSAEDQEMIKELESSQKDKAENVMIVDLVRNDLARISESGSIKVSELFGIYSYLQVHQMISTVQSKLKKGLKFSDILYAAFPMGSMTGAPKIAAMKYIEILESFQRGWYSGSTGYISPDGDFDFNVVIRSVICDEINNKIHYCAGGAITIDSIPEEEWNEVRLKTKAITEMLNDSSY